MTKSTHKHLKWRTHCLRKISPFSSPLLTSSMQTRPRSFFATPISLPWHNKWPFSNVHLLDEFHGVIVQFVQTALVIPPPVGTSLDIDAVQFSKLGGWDNLGQSRNGKPLPNISNLDAQQEPLQFGTVHASRALRMTIPVALQLF